MIWLLSENNVTDRHYRSTIEPNNLTGANAGSVLAHLGPPRMLLIAVKARAVS